MKFFVLATCHELNDHFSFLVVNKDALMCGTDAQHEVRSRVEKAGLANVKYVIVQFTRVE
ncbi:hypothetical protein ABHC16_23495 [Escherichia coli]